MSTLTHFGHSCVRLDLPGGSVVIDPGAFSDTDAALAGAGTVLVTHEHVDHVVPETLAAWLATEQGAGVHVHAPEPVVAALTHAGAPADRLHAVTGGDTIETAGTTVTVLGEWHAVIHPDVPRIHNVGYLLQGVLHPGDAFLTPPAGTTVDVLLAPIGAPWLKLAETVDWVRAVAPRRVVPIHEAVLSEPGRNIAGNLLTNLGGAGDPVVLENGKGIDL